MLLWILFKACSFFLLSQSYNISNDPFWNIASLLSVDFVFIALVGILVTKAHKRLPQNTKKIFWEPSNSLLVLITRKKYDI